MFFRTVKDKRDELYNCILESLKEFKVGFRRQQNTLAETCVKKLQDVMWYIGPYISGMSKSRGYTMPQLLLKWAVFRDVEGIQKRKLEPVSVKGFSIIDML